MKENNLRDALLLKYDSASGVILCFIIVVHIIFLPRSWIGRYYILLPLSVAFTE